MNRKIKEKYKDIMPSKLSWFSRRKWLIGADEIAQFIDCELHDLIAWMGDYDDCPISRNLESILVVKKAHMRKFLKQYDPPISPIVKFIHLKPKEQRRRSRWHL